MKGSHASGGREPEPSQSDLEKWIAHTGFPLEMRCATILEKTGFQDVVIGQHFVDPDHPEILHEIDVVGTVHFRVADGPEVVIRLVCECKYSKGRPWVSLTWHRRVDTANPYLHTLGTPPAKRFFAETFPKLPGSSNLPSSIPIAYHVVQFQEAAPIVATGRKGQMDAANQAIEQVTRAGLARIGSIIAREGSATSVFEVVIPVVVLDGALYSGEVGPGGDVKLKPVAASLLLRDRLDEGGLRVPVQLITITSLEKWSAGFWSSWATIVDDFHHEIQASIEPPR